MKALLDTHIWVWWLTGNPALTIRERTALDTAATAGELYLATISLWEAQMLHARKRLALPLPIADWLPRATDRLIVATAKTHRLRLATRDLRIRASRTVQLWKP